MGQIKTIKELKDAIEKCCRGDCLVSGSRKESIFIHYRDLILGVFAGFSDDQELPAFSSLSFSKGFDDFVLSAGETDLEERLRFLHHDLFEWANTGKAEIKQSAVRTMREVKKSKIIGVISALFVVLLGSIALWILSIFGVLSQAWGELTGIVDLTFGITFFTYELYDDKLQESEILDGDAKTIKKYINISVKQKATRGGSNVAPGATVGNLVTGNNNQISVHEFKINDVDGLFKQKKGG